MQGQCAAVEKGRSWGGEGRRGERMAGSSCGSERGAVRDARQVMRVHLRKFGLLHRRAVWSSQGIDMKR